LVKAGSVLIDGSPAKKVATPVHADQSLELAAGVEGWVSRAAYKLVAALEAFGPRGLSVAGKRCFDVAHDRSWPSTSAMTSWPRSWRETPESSNAPVLTSAMRARATLEGPPSCWLQTSASSRCGSG